MHRFETFLTPTRVAAQRVHGSPSFLGHGVLASVATHALLLGGYSLYLACVAMWPEFFTPQWYPPQAGVFSHARAASKAIVIEAAFERRTMRGEPSSVALRVPSSRVSEPFAAALTARETYQAQRTETEPPRPDRPEPDLPELASVPHMVAHPTPEQFGSDRPIPASEQPPPPARVPRSELPVSFNSVTSVASAATRKSEGAESAVPPRMVFNPAPVYPEAENAAGVGGLVKIYVRLDTDGGVEAARIYVSSGVVALDQAALAAVRRWRFEPLASDRPTAREVIVRTRFAPGESR